MVNWPVAGPPASGVKKILIEHVCWGSSTEERQVLLSLNGPVTAILEMSSGWSPELVSPTVCCALVVTSWPEKLTAAEDKLAAGPMPMPVRLTVCGLLVALEVMIRLAVRVPKL